MKERLALAQLKQGNLQSLEALVEQYQLKAVRTAYLITQDRGTAEDIVQSAFIQLPKRLQRFDMSRPFEPWFMKCVVNDALKATRYHARWVSLEADELLADNFPNPETQLEVADREYLVREALRKLPPQQRAVIVMRYYLDMSEREISEEINIAPGTVKSRLNRARIWLSGWLKNHMLSAHDVGR